MSWTQGKKILVPVDFSELSIKAVDQAIEISGDSNHITVLSVVEVMPAYDYGAIYNNAIDQEHANTAMSSLKKQFSDDRYEGLSFETVLGDPPHGITDFASANDIDLIVVASHGRTGAKRLFIGSVAERVVRLAHCPVLVLRE